MPTKTYLIYKLTSPSGKMYIGLTGIGVRKRWWSHITTANKGEPTYRPIIHAIRKYGADSFTYEVLCDNLDKESASVAEMFFISTLNTIAPFGYNVTPGGENGSNRVLWDRLDKNPEEKAIYCARLSEACKNGRHMKRIDVLLAATKAWREANPEKIKEAAKRGSATRQALLMSDPVRAAQITANKAKLARVIPRSDKERTSERTRRQAEKQWADRSNEERKQVCEKIAIKHKARNACLTPQEKMAKDAQLARAREKLDRVKWAAAIAAGRKAYWTPERREEARKRMLGNSRATSK